MRRLAGYVFDTYDDIDGRVLQSIVPSFDQVPDFVKTAHRLSGDEIQKLPDDNFALVMFDEGRKMKKYATVDKGNTALSVMYLLKQAHLLPAEAVKVAASNLVQACLMHGMEVPQLLKLAAAVGISGVSAKSPSLFARGAKLFHAKMKDQPNEFSENPQLGRHNAAVDNDLAQRANVNTTPGENFRELPVFSQKERKLESSGGAIAKMAYSFGEAASDLGKQFTTSAGRHELAGLGGKAVRGLGYTGGALYTGKVLKDAVAGKEKTAGVFTDAPGEVRTREKSFRELPYVDVSGWNPAEATVEDKKAPEQTLLHGHYPVDAYDQVKTASSYFEENWKEFHPRDRHEYCANLMPRLEKLGMEIPEDVARYGAQTYASDVDMYVDYRRPLVDSEFLPALETLKEKRAHVRPDTFAEALSEFDTISGLKWHWDGVVPDPWKSTFGPSLEKVAAAEWCYDENGIRIDEDLLVNLATNGHTFVAKKFGADFAKEFAKSPKSFFEALPAPNKLIVARAAASYKDF